MDHYIHRAFMLFVCVGLLALQPNEVCGLRRSDLALRRDRGDRLVMVKSHRVLNAVHVNNLNTDKKPAPVNKKFDSNQSSKRKVRRGSDPIHNRT
ncbi:CLAVATA3/ESR (CLE)-related protein 45 [Sesamum indicum]|uniref:CLAVATA3/ESR (CLE)-related protein 45 n=1 Tax=Sesamum indicum TaxID=4182 RepID=A0A6I9SV60_SESIN|nr:CLAVATA3/ESR (CLE)-related protein 45 [Sesamum indicum]